MTRVLLVVVVAALVACGAEEPAPVASAASGEMARLGVHSTGPATASTITLPPQLDDAEFELKALACRAGGYDLDSAAGAEVLFTGADISQRCAGQPAMIWVVTRGDSVVCAYKSVRRESLMAPGIWAANDPACHD
jgi:hypothetical protein